MSANNVLVNSVIRLVVEIIITAGGENVPSIPVEDDVKSRLPVLSNCMLIGDGRPYLTMLITIKVVQHKRNANIPYSSLPYLLLFF